MKILLAILILFPTVLNAQVPVATPNSRIFWNQEGYQGDYVFKLYIDGTPNTLVAKCTPINGPDGQPIRTDCEAPLPAMTVGKHVLELTTSVTIEGNVLESPKSVPLNVVMTIIPISPTNLRIR